MKRIFLMLLLMACHDLNNQHDSIALQCDMGMNTRDQVILKFTDPAGMDLSPEQILQLQVQYLTNGKTETLQPSSRACVVVRPGEAKVQARIAGDEPLKAEVSLNDASVTDVILPIAMDVPGYLELGLKCPKNGLLAAEALGDIVEVKQALGNLSGYAIDLRITSAAGEPIQSLYSKDVLNPSFILPQKFDLRSLSEGSYKVALVVIDSDHKKQTNPIENSCGLIIRRSCAADENFDSTAISCIPKLCDNTYRIGAQWSESLALKRGEGRYECQLRNNEAQKTLLSHTCVAGYFKSENSCIAATKIQDTCALLETGDVSCWGTLPGKEIFNSDSYPAHDYNYQHVFHFQTPATDIESNCAATTDGKVYCWSLDLETYPPRYSLHTKSWEQIVPSQFKNFRHGCGIKHTGEFFCGVNADGTGGHQINIPERVIDFSPECLVDAKGTLWCTQTILPRSQFETLNGQVSIDGYYALTAIPGPVRSVGNAHGTGCLVLQNGQVMCWGNNQFGSLGSNTSALASSHPVYVVDSLGAQLSEITSITVFPDQGAGSSTCAIQKDGRTVCWGSNLSGQLANGTPGEDDEGNPLFSRFAVPLNVLLVP